MHTKKYLGGVVFSLIAATSAFAQMSAPEPMPMPMSTPQAVPGPTMPERPDLSSGTSATSGSYATGSGEMNPQTSPLLFASDPHVAPQIGMQDNNLYRGN